VRNKNSPKSLEELIKNVEKDHFNFNEKPLISTVDTELNFFPSKASQINRRQFFSVLRKILDKADVILEILDARDPTNTRCKALEKEAAKRGKKIMFILNKIDLVPQNVVKGWVSYLQQFYPTIAFKSVVSNPSSYSFSSSSKNQFNGGNENNNTDHSYHISHGDSIGNFNFLSSLKSAMHSNSSLRVIVGVVGYPNVGKSSFINRYLVSIFHL
jgi:nuclear GTP-binding protein